MQYIGTLRRTLHLIIVYELYVSRGTEDATSLTTI